MPDVRRLLFLPLVACASTPTAALQWSSTLLSGIVVAGVLLMLAGAGVMLSSLASLDPKRPIPLVHRELSALDARHTRTEVSPTLLRWMTGLLLILFGLGLTINVKDQALQAMVAASEAHILSETVAIEPTTLSLTGGEE